MSKKSKQTDPTEETLEKILMDEENFYKTSKR